MKLNDDTLCPFVEITFKTSLALDKEMFVVVEKIHKDSVTALMLDEYKQFLEPEMDKIREKLLAPTKEWEDITGRYAMMSPSFLTTKTPVKVRVTEGTGALVKVEVVGSQREVLRAGFRWRQVHRSHLSLFKNPEDPSDTRS